MPLPPPPQIDDIIEEFDYCESELVIGLVYAVGTDYKPVQQALEGILKQHGYAPRVVRISELISGLTDSRLLDDNEINRISTRMTAGNAACRDSGRLDIWAVAAISEINKARGGDIVSQGPLKRTAHIVLSLKRPQEVSTFRKVHGDGFFFIGVFATEKERLDNLIEKNAPKQAAIDLIRRDEEELSDDYGQETRETFHRADVFRSVEKRCLPASLARFFQLVFSDPYVTPTQQEHAMFLAFASSLRSGQLGRQVRAAITSKRGDVLAVGCNDVPQPGGGLYWPGPNDNRDHVLGFDTNDAQKDKIVDQLLKMTGSSSNDLRRSFRGILDITEYGRAVHAEMDALLTCARSGVSPTGSILYTTTFPCHNCTRHIIAAGVERVIYIEPYAKSRAEELHGDAIVVEEKAMKPNRGSNRRVPFTHFVGVGPRRYSDLFSLSLSSGHELKRKEAGKKLNLQLDPSRCSWPRIPLSPLTYIERERAAIQDLERLPKQMDFFE